MGRKLLSSRGSRRGQNPFYAVAPTCTSAASRAGSSAPVAGVVEASRPARTGLSPEHLCSLTSRPYIQQVIGQARRHEAVCGRWTERP